MNNRKAVSSQSHDQAVNVAKGTQKPGQTKEQTKLIATGIEKGIAQYKKQHKAKQREQDKQRKKQNKKVVLAPLEQPSLEDKPTRHLLPWILLIVSWGLFATYITLQPAI